MTWDVTLTEGPGWDLVLLTDELTDPVSYPDPQWGVGVVAVGPRGPAGAPAEEVATFSFTGELDTLTGSTRYYFETEVELESFRVSLGTPPSSGQVLVDLRVSGVVVATAVLLPGWHTVRVALGGMDMGPEEYLTVDVAVTGPGAADLVAAVRAAPRT